MNPSDLAAKLGDKGMLAASLPVVAGFDAFLDEVVQVVGTRHSPENYTALPTIGEFGSWASASAGRSGLREFVSIDRTSGGCSVNSIDGITALGFPVDAFVGVGTPADPVFNELHAQCRSLHSLGMEPGRAMVYEFQDGKLMFCSFSHFSQYTPDYLTTVLADGNYRNACETAAGIVLTSWSVYPHMTECWRYLQREVFSHLKHRPQFFLDLADPASRSPGDLIGMMDALAGFEAVGPTSLSLNGNEANQIARALGEVTGHLEVFNLFYLAEWVFHDLQDYWEHPQLCMIFGASLLSHPFKAIPTRGWHLKNEQKSSCSGDEEPEILGRHYTSLCVLPEWRGIV